MRKMSEKRIITATLTGAMSPKAVNPNVPVTPEEIAEDAYKCYKAGAAIVHLHMRNAQDEACSDVELFRESQRLIREKCDVIINMTTTGTNAANTAVCEEAYNERIAPVIELEPEMCSYDAASFNWMSETLYIPEPARFSGKAQQSLHRAPLQTRDRNLQSRYVWRDPVVYRPWAAARPLPFPVCPGCAGRPAGCAQKRF